jgi:hypothetical protein
MRQTAIQELIQEFNKELEVSTQIGNEDKIRTIKHLINIATRYLPKEKHQMQQIFFRDFSDNDFVIVNDFEQYYNKTFKSE